MRGIIRARCPFPGDPPSRQAAPPARTHPETDRKTTPIQRRDVLIALGTLWNGDVDVDTPSPPRGRVKM
jgi:hypothetical protein